MPYTDAGLNYNSDCQANREQDDADACPAISGSAGEDDVTAWVDGLGLDG